jgi:myosin heavy subunit
MARPASPNPLAGFSNIIQQAKEQEASVTEENSRLKTLAKLQDDLIQKQRSALLEVAHTSAELAEVEKQRTILKARLAAQKTKLLVAASEAAQASSIIEKVIEASSPSPIASSQSGAVALSAIEKIQSELFGVTDQCMKAQNLSVSPEIAGELVCSVNDIIEEAIRTGAVDESPEDTVKRQSYVISALIPQPEE